MRYWECHIFLPKFLFLILILSLLLQKWGYVYAWWGSNTLHWHDWSWWSVSSSVEFFRWKQSPVFKGGHRCGACHSAYDAKVRIKCYSRMNNVKIIEQKKSLSVYVPCTWQCVGLLYAFMVSSRWCSYGGLNALLGNVWCCVMWLQCVPTVHTVGLVTVLGLIWLHWMA